MRNLIVADHVSGVPGSFEKHDLPVRTRHLPNVRRPDVGVSNMSQGGRQANSAVLEVKDRHGKPRRITRWLHCILATVSMTFSGRKEDGRLAYSAR